MGDTRSWHSYIGPEVRQWVNGWYMLLTQLQGAWSEAMNEWVIHAPDTVTRGLDWGNEWMGDTCSWHSYKGPEVRQWMNGWYMLLTQLHGTRKETMNGWVIHAPDTVTWGLERDNEWMGDTCSWHSYMGPGVRQWMNGWYMLLTQLHGVWSEKMYEWVIHAPDTVTRGLKWGNEWMGDTCSWHSYTGFGVWQWMNGWYVLLTQLQGAWSEAMNEWVIHAPDTVTWDQEGDNEWMGDTCSWHSYMGPGARQWMNGWYMLLTQLHGTRSETMNEWVIHAPDTVTWGLEWDNVWMGDTCSWHICMGPGVRQWMNGWYMLLTQLHGTMSEKMNEWLIHASDTVAWDPVVGGQLLLDQRRSPMIQRSCGFRDHNVEGHKGGELIMKWVFTWPVSI